MGAVLTAPQEGCQLRGAEGWQVLELVYLMVEDKTDGGEGR